MTRMVYLAYPIDQASGSVPINMYGQIGVAKNRMLESGVEIVFDPGDAFKVRADAKIGPEIAAINRHAAHLADGMLVVLPRGVPTVGVPIEMDRALSQNKWVALCSDADAWMLADTRKGLARFGCSGADLLAAATWLAACDSKGPYPEGDRAEPLPVHRLDPYAVLPYRGYRDDAGLDLVVSTATEIPPGFSLDVPCGVAVELPSRYWGLIIGRSSTRRTKGLLVHPGVIDTGWRGELFVNCENQTGETIKIEAGERVGQLIVMYNSTRLFEPEEVAELSPHPRGLNGFGSTGK